MRTKSSKAAKLRSMAYRLHYEPDVVDGELTEMSEQIERFEDRAFCQVCLESMLLSPTYMVHRSVWEFEAGFGGRSLVHLSCLQDVLGRSITYKDLTAAKCNDNLRAVLKGKTT